MIEQRVLKGYFDCRGIETSVLVPLCFKEGEAIWQEVSELTATNHQLKEQTETLTGDKEKLLSENEKLEKQQKKLQQEINKMVQSIGGTVKGIRAGRKGKETPETCLWNEPIGKGIDRI